MEIGVEQMHIFSLAFMIIVYGIRILWIMRFRLLPDRASARGSSTVGAATAMTTMFRPLSMESTRKGLVQWVEFVFFHIGVAVMIGMSFVIPFAPWLLTPQVVVLAIVTQIGGLIAGMLRLVKRIREPKMRAISSPDDYFALAITNVLFVLCIAATLHVPLAYQAYFLTVAFIIAYVPFSKISHYLYYPIARYFYGSYLGRRGILR